MKKFLFRLKEENKKLYEEIKNVFKLFESNYIVNEYLIKESIKNFLVKENILFLDPLHELLKPQSQLTWQSIKKALKELYF